MTRKIPTGECVICGFRKRIRKDGTVYAHTRISALELEKRVCGGGAVAPVPGTQHWPADDVLYSLPDDTDDFETNLRALVIGTAVVAFLVAFAVVWAVYR